MATDLKGKGCHSQYVFCLESAHGDRAVRAQNLPQDLEWVWQGYIATADR